MKGKNDRISVVIPTAANEELKSFSIWHVVDSLRHIEAFLDEILIVHNRHEGTSELADTGAGGVLLRHLNCLKENNRAAARNLGIAEAHSKWVLLLDDDTLVSRDAAPLIDEAFATQTGLLFPRRLYLPMSVFEGKRRRRLSQSDLESALPLPGEDRLPEPSEYQLLPMRFAFPSSFSLLPKRAIVEAGLFDPRFRGWGLEDVDFALRVIETSPWKNLFGLHAVIHLDHLLSPYQWRDLAANERLMKRKHGAVSVFDLAEWVVAGGEHPSVEKAAVGGGASDQWTGPWGLVRATEGIIAKGVVGSSSDPGARDIDLVAITRGGEHRFEVIWDRESQRYTEIRFAPLWWLTQLIKRFYFNPGNGLLERLTIAGANWEIQADVAARAIEGLRVLGDVEKAFFLTYAVGRHLLKEQKAASWDLSVQSWVVATILNGAMVPFGGKEQRPWNEPASEWIGELCRKEESKGLAKLALSEALYYPENLYGAMAILGRSGWRTERDHWRLLPL